MMLERILGFPLVVPACRIAIGDDDGDPVEAVPPYRAEASRADYSAYL
jgi:hypothetical protein